MHNACFSKLSLNKKRKILTLATLAVFGAIIVWHYTGWTVVMYQSPWEKVVDIREDNILGEREQGSEVTILTSWFDPSGRRSRVKIKNPGRVTDFDFLGPLFLGHFIFSYLVYLGLL